MTKKVAPDHPLIGLLTTHLTLAAELGLAVAIERGLVNREDAVRQLRRLERLAPPEEEDVHSRHA